jgi:hypothetical protein
MPPLQPSVGDLFGGVDLLSLGLNGRQVDLVHFNHEVRSDPKLAEAMA